jgi:hypothetical protein
MRAKRALEEVARSAGTVRPSMLRMNHKGKGKDTGIAGLAMQTSSSSMQPSLPSQESMAGEPMASSSRPRQETASGRQSVLGEYWSAQVLASEQMEVSNINPITDAELWF